MRYRKIYVQNLEVSFKINLDGKAITRRDLLSMMSSIYNPLSFAAPFVLEGRGMLQSLCNKSVHLDGIVQKNVQSDKVGKVSEPVGESSNF